MEEYLSKCSRMATYVKASPSLALITAVASASALWLGYSMINKNFVRKSKYIRDDNVVIELIEGERLGMIHAASVSTITFYDGDFPREYLEKRVEEILIANPWLTSRLVQIPERGGLCAVYGYSNKISIKAKLADHFTCVTRPELSTKLSYKKIMSMISGFMVKMGTSCIEKDEPLFKVVLIAVSDGKFALIVSLSHVIGDGHTFYNVYGMLNPSSPVITLSDERNQNFPRDVRIAQGPAINDWLVKATTLIGFVANLIFGREPDVGVYTIDPQLVEKAKQVRLEACVNNTNAVTGSDTSATFLSTNDIVSASFFQTCKLAFSMMAVNYRNRIAGYTDKMVGNYESVLVYEQKEAADPLCIRQSLVRGGSASGVMPNLWQSLLSSVSVATNWSSFYQDVDLVGATQDIHLPVGNPSDSIFRDVVVIFRPNRRVATAVIFFTRSHNISATVAGMAGVLGKQLLLDN